MTKNKGDLLKLKYIKYSKLLCRDGKWILSCMSALKNNVSF